MTARGAAAGSTDSETTTHNLKVDGGWERERWKGREGHVPLPSFVGSARSKTGFIEEGAALRAGGGVAEEVFE